MTRGRSKSIVQKIANDVPKLNNSENALDYLLKENGGENNLTHTSTTYKMSRSKSLSQEGRNNNMELEKVHQADSITYPFTKSEFQKAESDNINSYDYDTILKPRDISHITDLQLNNILNFKTWSKGTRLKLSSLLVKQMTFCLVLKHFYPSTIESRMKLLISTKEPTSYWSYRSTTRRNMTKSIAICNILSNWIL